MLHIPLFVVHESEPVIAHCSLLIVHHPRPPVHCSLVSTTASTCPARATPPCLHRTARTVPATPATAGNSIFMLSSTATVWPASTGSPSATSTRRTLPASGAFTPSQP